FLTEMDGFERREGVVVLAATNAPWDIDPALRRAGRFSDQVFVPPPDEEGRRQIFGIHTRNLPVGSDVALDELAKLTDGFSSADIKLICDEAAKIPWKESMQTGEKRDISLEDFKEVIAESRPSIDAWIKQAEKQLAGSDEQEIYDGLWKLVSQRKEAADPENAEIRKQLEYVKREIDVLTQKKATGEIPEEVYNSLLVEYQKQMISLEAKLKK
ncbi:MAG: AAA family ATPase, partial [Candidatus Altiarchaeales archaeon]|nr:AAA family ATPase [Candidatus Altiarchaeales archaeon]MBD3417217.1 AAA family ATPase [Candidatus Altiarchaeales archaeon]